jgi:anti-sigma regulatory factor (Ser/Thr protein kinase)
VSERQPSRWAKGSDRLDLRLEAKPENVAFVRRALEGMGLPSGLLEDAKLLATELVTNSVRHAGLRSEDQIHVRAEWTINLRVMVVDGPSAPDGKVAGAIRPAPGADSGFGLYLVDQIASRWGTNRGGGRGYWFELYVPAGSSADED